MRKQAATTFDIPDRAAKTWCRTCRAVRTFDAEKQARGRWKGRYTMALACQDCGHTFQARTTARHTMTIDLEEQR